MSYKKNCVFCKVARKEIQHDQFWENKSYIAFLDAHPETFGHSLVIPKEHVEYIFSLRQKNYLNLLKASEKVARALKKATKCKRVAMRIFGFEVNHVHVHLVPLNTIAETVAKRTRKPSRKQREELVARLAELLK